MKLYRYRQNNSGGRWVGNYLHIYIEANDSNEADEIAELKTNIYFDGCEIGRDCDCCGDRWSRCWDDGEEVINIKQFIRIYNKQQILWRYETSKKYHPEEVDTLTKVKKFIKETKKSLDGGHDGLKNLILLKNGDEYIFDMKSTEIIKYSKGTDNV